MKRRIGRSPRFRLPSRCVSRLATDVLVDLLGPRDASSCVAGPVARAPDGRDARAHRRVSIFTFVTPLRDARRTRRRASLTRNDVTAETSPASALARRGDGVGGACCGPTLRDIGRAAVHERRKLLADTQNVLCQRRWTSPREVADVRRRELAEPALSACPKTHLR